MMLIFSLLSARKNQNQFNLRKSFEKSQWSNLIIKCIAIIQTLTNFGRKVGIMLLKNAFWDQILFNFHTLSQAWRF